MSGIIGEAAKNVEIVNAQVSYTLKIKILCICSQSLYLYNYLIQFIRLQPMGRPESVNASLKDETYNHLYESDKKDMNVSYDHVNMVSSSCAGEDELGNLTSVGNNSIPGGQD